jgi:hypothetical protein
MGGRSRAGLNPRTLGAVMCSEGGAMAKRHGRPSVQYRYEHYDPRM